MLGSLVSYNITCNIKNINNQGVLQPFYETIYKNIYNIKKDSSNIKPKTGSKCKIGNRHKWSGVKLFGCNIVPFMKGLACLPYKNILK